MWPYGLNHLLRLQDKWAKVISINIANHLPPKMACLFGAIWNQFSGNYLRETVNLISLLFFKEWLKKLLMVVQINSGSIYQMDTQKKQVSEYFVNLICDSIYVSPQTNLDTLEESNTSSFVASYRSLGKYVARSRLPTAREYLIEMGYDF